MNARNSGKRIVICATQRSGSTLLCEDLRNNGLGNAEEHFLGLVNRSNLDEVGPVLERIRQAGTDAGGNFSIKIMSSYAPRVDAAMRSLGHGAQPTRMWAGLADYCKDVCWIYLDRRGKIAQAVSRAMSRATGINHAVSSGAASFIPGRTSIGYDKHYNEKVAVPSAEVAQHVLDIVNESHAWETFFQANGLQPLRLYYEELVEAPTYVNVLRMRLGLPEGAINAERKLVRLANQRSEQIMLHYLEAFGETGERPAVPVAAGASAVAPAPLAAVGVSARRTKACQEQLDKGRSHVAISSVVDMKSLTRTVGEISRRWAHTPYYDAVEKIAQKQWEKLISPFIAPAVVDFEHVLELAVGHGRMTAILLDKAKRLTGVDVLQENIDFCSKRFDGRSHLTLLRNDGVTLKDVADGSVTFAFCFDSMVHFDSDVVRTYLGEFARVLKPGGLAFCHHSNLDKSPGGDFQKSPHARNFMSQQLFRHYAQKSGIEVVKSRVIDWGQGEKFVAGLDCLSLLRRTAIT